MLNRSSRLLRPTTAFLVVLAASGFGARTLGVDPGLVALAVWAAAIPLWFLVAYLSLVFLSPLTYALQRRMGLAFPLGAAALVPLFDIASLRYAVPAVGGANYLLVWLVFHQVGIAWQDGTIRAGARALALLCGAGIAALIGLTVLGPYPVSMVGVPGADLQNTSPPSFALLVLGLTQACAALALSEPVNRILRGARAWTAVVAANAVVLTLFLWHMAAAVLAAAALYGSGIMPEPDVDAGAWLPLRLPWLAVCAAVLAVFVGIFARIETRPGGPPRVLTVVDAAVCNRIGLPRTGWRALTVTAMMCIVAGLLVIAVADSSYEGVVGVPLIAFILYLVGASVLRLARYRHASADAVRPRR